VNQEFGGFVPAIVPLRAGNNAISVFYVHYVESYRSYSVAYRLELDVEAGGTRVTKAAYSLGSDCFVAKTTTDADNWVSRTLNSTLPEQDGMLVLEIAGDLPVSYKCGGSTSFGSQRYIRLHVTSSPQEAEFTLENLPPRRTPATVVLNVSELNVSVPVVRLYFSKDGFFPLAYAYPVSSAFGDIHVVLSRIPKSR